MGGVAIPELKQCVHRTFFVFISHSAPTRGFDRRRTASTRLKNAFLISDPLEFLFYGGVARRVDGRRRGWRATREDERWTDAKRELFL